jgi:hypothetical protein
VGSTLPTHFPQVLAMPLTDLLRVRYKTTLNETLLPDAIINDFIAEYTSDGTVDLNAAIADSFDYMAAATGDGYDVKSWTRGQTSMQFSTTLRESAAYYRGLSDSGPGIEQRTLSRADYPPTDGAQYSIAPDAG